MNNDKSKPAELPRMPVFSTTNTVISELEAKTDQKALSGNSLDRTKRKRAESDIALSKSNSRLSLLIPNSLKKELMTLSFKSKMTGEKLSETAIVIMALKQYFRDNPNND
jgi:hypothetical protein